VDLGRIFHNSRHARAATGLVMSLIDIGSVSQAALLKALYEMGDEYKLSPSDASRIFSKLEQYGYITRKRVGNEKRVAFNF
jgi:DNA-binding MarR family transcriptional regulator